MQPHEMATAQGKDIAVPESLPIRALESAEPEPLQDLPMPAVIGHGEHRTAFLGKLDPPDSARVEAHLEAAPTTRQEAARNFVLVVDDEPVVRAVARRILERGGYAVIETCDGEEAVRRFEESCERVVAVLMDMAMPVMDGEQAFQAIRATGVVVPVVFSSGYLPRDAVNRLLQEPATAFMAKPYRPSRLLEVLAELIGDASTIR